MTLRTTSGFRRFMAAMVWSALQAATTVLAQESDFWPGAKYDAAIPTLKQVVRHEPTMKHQAHPARR